MECNIPFEFSPLFLIKIHLGNPIDNTETGNASQNMTVANMTIGVALGRPLSGTLDSMSTVADVADVAAGGGEDGADYVPSRSKLPPLWKPIYNEEKKTSRKNRSTLPKKNEVGNFYCIDCKEYRGRNKFHKYHANQNGLAYACKDCKAKKKKTIRLSILHTIRTAKHASATQ